MLSAQGLVGTQLELAKQKLPVSVGCEGQKQRDLHSKAVATVQHLDVLPLLCSLAARLGWAVLTSRRERDRKEVGCRSSLCSLVAVEFAAALPADL